MAKDGKNLATSLMELEERDFLIHTQFDIDDGYIFQASFAVGNHL